ncbi:MAG: type I-F CRISPR-associated protein Csy1 [SAR324 cluster bacterium]|nr:type I-F CRISPR-associated protein Csy1 [SAR324 cluster bacterium]MBL7035516.1 type I-F CRISPR-associated protein Csy1 [SAR324 cluster bacterium]
MSEVVNKPEFTTWTEVILDFFENRVGSSALYKARKYIEKKEQDIKKEKESKKLQKAIDAKEKKEQELHQLRGAAPYTEIRDWIEKESKKKIVVGRRIINATHVLKFTHGSSESAGLLLKIKSDDLLLTTASLKKELTLDLAHNNGALITVSRFLALSFNNERIIDKILRREFDFFAPFCKNETQKDSWENGFSNLVEERVDKTADKAKQLYFPIAKNVYQIIILLFPSSLANEIDSVVTDIKFGNQREINKLSVTGKDDSEKRPKFHQQHSLNFPNLGSMSFGGEHPKNISMLNADRGGKSYLFSTKPPTWQTQLKPPIFKKSLFDNFCSAEIREDINYLQEFVRRFEQISLSIKNPERLKWINAWLDNIIDELFFQISTIQNLPAGWSVSEDIRLKEAHQFLLDPYRIDDEFQVQRKATDWQAIICSDFARWLNRQLIGKEKQFTPQEVHTTLWKQRLEQPLREQMQLIEIERKLYPKEEL